MLLCKWHVSSFLYRCQIKSVLCDVKLLERGTVLPSGSCSRSTPLLCVNCCSCLKVLCERRGPPPVFLKLLRSSFDPSLRDGMTDRSGTAPETSVRQQPTDLICVSQTQTPSAAAFLCQHARVLLWCCKHITAQDLCEHAETRTSSHLHLNWQ